MDPTSKKASYKKSICHWVWLGSAEERPWPTLEKGTRAREVRISGKKKKKKLQRPQTEPTMGSRRVGLPWACDFLTRRVRLGAPGSLRSPGTRRVSASSAARPLRPNTAPDPPFLRRLGYPSGARRHTEPRSRSAPGLWESAEFKSPDVKLAQAKTLKISSGRLQERRVKGLTSLEKLCDKLRRKR